MVHVGSYGIEWWLMVVDGKLWWLMVVIDRFIDDS